MSITLLTGVPGSGKTSKAVFELAALKGSRPLYVMGIPDLKIEHQPVPPVEEWTRLEPSPEDPKVLSPVFNFPANSVIVIDEAQKVFRPRGAGARVPDIVAAFETHRHTGVDFILITQGPGLLDSNIRKLVAKHWHVHVTPFGSRLLEWSQCRDPDSKTDRADALSIGYKPSKKTFELYKSAETHTVLKRSIPRSLLLFVFCSVLAVVLGVYAYQRIAKRVSKPEPVVAEKSDARPVPVVAPAPPVRAAGPVVAGTVAGYVEQFTPVHPNFPESAPAYEAMRIVKAMPVVAGCIKTATFCRCFSQQGTKLDIQADRCGEIIAGRVFDPYREAVQVAALNPPGQKAGIVSRGAESVPAAAGQ